VRNTFGRIFRKFNVIKTFHRSTMTDERLTNLAVMSIESETAKTKIWYDWVDKIICILQNLEKVIFLTWNMANAKACLRYRLCWCSEPSPEYLKLKGFTFEQEWLDILQIDKNSTDLYCFIVQFGGACNFVRGAKPTKASCPCCRNMFSWTLSK